MAYLKAAIAVTFGVYTGRSFVDCNFLPRDIMLSVVYAVVVCLSVCLSHSSIVSKWLNVQSRK